MDERGYYDKVYKESKEYSKNPKDSIYYRIWSKIVDITGNDESLFEIGCGPGQLAQLLIGAGRNYFYGMDYSNVAIEMAKRNNPNDEDKFKVQDIYTLQPFDFDDTVICTEVLEHLDDDLFVLSLLTKGTRFIFSVPNFMVQSHRRCFKTEAEVTSRYKGLKYHAVYPFRMGKRGMIFLADAEKL